eukprot:TRINITY_DN80930_c0_g1_i1.p1 TRINITY_DN80930_c0_g1~~TRINITY_DN80930_c0_g1_i1.p1  ORF type:complete len:730 (-),score=148.10 TRINITY_DN80930_c0_g1_i1:42-2183(-)
MDSRRERSPPRPRNTFVGGQGYASQGHFPHGRHVGAEEMRSARVDKLSPPKPAPASSAPKPQQEEQNSKQASESGEAGQQDLSTLDYLDKGGRVHNFLLVPWAMLHEWLSSFNGYGNVDRPEGLTRGAVLKELERRRKLNKSKRSLVDWMSHVAVDVGEGRDWRDYENPDGFTHLEELLIFQPEQWRQQAREYMFAYGFNINRQSTDLTRRSVDVPITYLDEEKDSVDTTVSVFMSNALRVALFHKLIPASKRYRPLNFLLAYDAEIAPRSTSRKACAVDLFLDSLVASGRYENTEAIKRGLALALSPKDYFFHFQENVAAYDFEFMQGVAKASGVPRFPLLKELDFCDIVGQRLAKHIIRKNVLHWLMNRLSADEMVPNKSPLSMIFAGPSGNGKTELGKVLADLLNKPQDDAFHKVDCGKLSDANEMFGMAGAYQGAQKGSAFNNFIVRMAQTDKVGVVLLDEIEKAKQDVIHALYQVIDKGEWTNKKLDIYGDSSQTGVVSCRNLIFIFTTNAADQVIEDLGKQNEWYTAPSDKLEDMADVLERTVRTCLQSSYPFTSAFVGRVGAVIPFLPMCDRSPAKHPLLGELMTVTKLLMEREQEKLSLSTGSQLAYIDQLISPVEKDKMAEIIVSESIPSMGVRCVQKLVGDRMSRQIIHRCALKKGGLQRNSAVEYHADVRDKDIYFNQIGARGGARSSQDNVSHRDSEALYE